MDMLGNLYAALSPRVIGLLDSHSSRNLKGVALNPVDEVCLSQRTLRFPLLFNMHVYMFVLTRNFEDYYHT